MSATPAVFPSVAALRAQVRAWRGCGDTIALVPTMGALHAGHLALVAEGRRRATRVVASIFVNPAQFAPTEDFSAYPRTFEADLHKLAQAKADGCFAPPVAEMYPPGFCATVSLEGPARAGLDDRFRPTHFVGVATVVAKLFNQCQPDCAIFGEKDFQQLLVIRAMARDLDMPVEVVGAETVREADGLALSSRNVYLTPQERVVAPTLNRALRDCAAAIRAGGPIADAVGATAALLAERGFVVDYVEARDARSLEPVAEGFDGPLRLLAAARLGKTRLIDNIAA